MAHSRIVGTGSYVPPGAVTNADVARMLHVDEATVHRLTGIRVRHWAGADEASSDLAVQAARRALEAAGVVPSAVDTVLVSTTSPDTVFPATACHLLRRLGAKGTAAFDLAASCSGFLYGLSMADVLIRSGQARRCLVVAAEVKSRYLDFEDKATVMLFGDGAGAALVVEERGGGPVAPGLLGVRLYADGSRHRLIRVWAGGSRQPASDRTLRERQHTLRMDGRPLFRIAVTRLAEAVSEILKEFGVGADEVAQVIFHQANGRLLAALCKRLALPAEKVYSVIEGLGNTSSASLPIALDHAVREGRIQSGDVVLLGTFGGGLTWATGLLRW
ncbi:3-oxoacyl-ACP synthase III family protein [Nitrospira sp. Kam-Ns4a]